MKALHVLQLIDHYEGDGDLYSVGMQRDACCTKDHRIGIDTLREELCSPTTSLSGGSKLWQ